MSLNNVKLMNLGYQKSVMSKTLHFLDEALEDIFREHIHDFPKCFRMVELGCASGPNTLLIMSHIMNKIEDMWRQKDIINELPEFEVFLNDLPADYFNKKRENCFVSRLLGSFYGRLLPINSTHFAYSSYSSQWLSQIPEGLKNKNKENIYMAMTSTPKVYEAYAKQYKRDFFAFLSSRAEEIISGGRMVLTLLSRSVEDSSTKDHLETFALFSETLLDMVDEGLVKMDALNSFNLPMYTPCTKEIEAAVETEGSFHLDKMHSFRVRWDEVENVDADQKSLLIFDKSRSENFVANCYRAFMELMLVSHFGSSINIDYLFGKFAKKVAEHSSTEKPAYYFNTMISLNRI